jgi:hypothetical protein
MAEPHVISALVKRRAELAGDIENTHERLHKMILDLDHLDRTLLMFDPEYRIDSIKPKAFRPPEDWSKRGEMTRLILGILRQAAEPLTARDIAVQLLTERALDAEDPKMVRLFRGRVACALRLQRDRGIVLSNDATGQYLVWELCTEGGANRHHPGC